MAFDVTIPAFTGPDVTAQTISKTCTGLAGTTLTGVDEIMYFFSVEDFAAQGPKNSNISIQHQYSWLLDDVEQRSQKVNKGIASTMDATALNDLYPQHGTYLFPQICESGLRLRSVSPFLSDKWATQDFDNNEYAALALSEAVTPVAGVYKINNQASGNFGGTSSVRAVVRVVQNSSIVWQSLCTHMVKGGGLAENYLEFTVSNVV